jgi:hypothetical protein
MKNKGILDIPMMSTNKKISQIDIGKKINYYHVELPNYFTDNLVCEGLVLESYGRRQVMKGEFTYRWRENLSGFIRLTPASKSNSMTNIK